MKKVFVIRNSFLNTIKTGIWNPSRSNTLAGADRWDLIFISVMQADARMDTKTAFKSTSSRKKLIGGKINSMASFVTKWRRNEIVQEPLNYGTLSPEDLSIEKERPETVYLFRQQHSKPLTSFAFQLGIAQMAQIC